MQQYVTIHVGAYASFDGGPFANYTVDLVEDGHLYGSGDGGDSWSTPAGHAEDALREDMLSDEPVRISGVHPDDGVLTFTFPVRPGYILDVHGGEAYLLGDLDDDDELDAALTDAEINGADYYPNN